MGNIAMACCCYQRRPQKVKKLGKDLKDAFGISLFNDSSDEEKQSQ